MGAPELKNDLEEDLRRSLGLHRPDILPGPLSTLRGAFVLALEATVIFAYGVLANCAFLLSAFIMPFSPRLAYQLNSTVAGTLWYYMQRSFEHTHMGLVSFSGDKLPDGENAFIVSNHCSFSDYYLVHSVALRHGMLPYCRYFAKFELIWQIPIFGLSLWLINMVLVKRNWTRDQASTRKAFAAIKNHKQPVWLVSYLEGHRSTPKRIEESKAFAKKHDKPILNNVLLPRTKGFVAAVQELRYNSQIKHLYDFTLAYRGADGKLQAAPSLSAVHRSRRLTPPLRFHVHVRRYALDDLPKKDVDLAAFAEQLFQEKDQVLEGLKREWTKAGELSIKHSGVFLEPYWQS